jgi:hypothetical protein
MQRIPPAGAGEIAHRVEAAVDRVESLVRGRPGVVEPALFLGADRENAPDALVPEVERRKTLQGLGEPKADMMHVGELLRHHEQRPQHDAYRLLDPLMLVDHLVRPGVGAQPVGEPREGRVGDVVRRAPDAAFQRGAG